MLNTKVCLPYTWLLRCSLFKEWERELEVIFHLLRPPAPSIWQPPALGAPLIKDGIPTELKPCTLSVK